MNRSATEAKRMHDVRAALKRLLLVGSEGAKAREVFGDEWSTVSSSNWCYKLVRTMRDHGLVRVERGSSAAGGLRITPNAALATIARDDQQIAALLWPSTQAPYRAAPEPVVTETPPVARRKRVPAIRELITNENRRARLAQARSALQLLIQASGERGGATGLHLFGDEWMPSRGSWYVMMRRLEEAGLVTVKEGATRLFVAQAGLMSFVADDVLLSKALPPAIFRRPQPGELVPVQEDEDDEQEASVAREAPPLESDVDEEPTDRDLLEALLKIGHAIGEGQQALIQRVLGLEQKLTNLQLLWK